MNKQVMKRVQELTDYLNTLENIKEYRFVEDGVHWITNEWLCGTFAGRAFTGNTQDEATQKLINYFDEHIGHDSMVGSAVKNSGWPNLARVKQYVQDEFYSKEDSE